jgi:hypothetical protein
MKKFLKASMKRSEKLLGGGAYAGVPSELKPGTPS